MLHVLQIYDQRISSAQNHALATRTSINIETHPPLNFLHFRRVFSRSEHLKYLRNSVASLSTTLNDQTHPIHPFEKSLANRIPGYISNTKRSPCRCIQWRRKLMQHASIAMQKRTFLKGTAHWILVPRRVAWLFETEHRSSPCNCFIRISICFSLFYFLYLFSLFVLSLSFLVFSLLVSIDERFLWITLSNKKLRVFEGGRCFHRRSNVE